jgi:PIN domain nuclease of toxin-antitoxin system
MKGPAFLDTNIAIFWASSHPGLPITVIDAISRHPKAYVSTISIAEVEIKRLLNKINVTSRFAEALTESGLSIEGFDETSAEQISRFESLVGHDPFDRMILAQASTHRNSTFYTTDRKLGSLGLSWIVHVGK